MFQKRNWAFPSTLKTWILCETGYESHPYRPANDLHTSPHVYGHLHEKVRTEVPLFGNATPKIHEHVQFNVQFLDTNTLPPTQAIGAILLEFITLWFVCL